MQLLDHISWGFGFISSSTQSCFNEENAPMLTEQDIQEWRDKKIENYIQNYARWNKFTIAHEKEKFFIGPHEIFIEVSHEIKQFFTEIDVYARVSYNEKQKCLN